MRKDATIFRALAWIALILGWIVIYNISYYLGARGGSGGFIVVLLIIALAIVIVRRL